MRRFVGEKGSFGFEYEIMSRSRYAKSGDYFVLGKTRLWIEGKYIGAFDDVNILSAIQYQFEGLELKDMDGCEFLGKPADEVFESIDSEAVPDSRRYLLSPGEAFDDFTIFTYICNDIIYFIWKLIDEPFFEYPGYPQGVQSGQVPVDEYRKVVMEFKKIITEFRCHGREFR